MSIAQYLKEIGRGKDGARSLDESQARDLMEQVLDLRVSDAERGAFAMAMRIKGETTEELAGFTAAAIARTLVLDAPTPLVLLPSYNGARRLPNLTPLLAWLLARQGVPVLVHGPTEEPQRVTSHALFAALGLPIADSADAALQAWQRQQPVFMPTAVLCPPLAALLALRRTIGVRNSGHTVAKLLAPVGGAPALRVVNYTHPEYGQAHRRFLQHVSADALLLRGTEGEPVADPRRRPRLEVFLAGVPQDAMGRGGQEGALSSVPVLPTGTDAAQTAQYIRAVVQGQAPMPEPLQEQIDVLVATRAALSARSGDTHLLR